MGRKDYSFASGEPGPTGVTAALLSIAAGLTLAISNHATAALVAPIASGVAASQGLDPQPELLAVAVDTTVALLSPFAHPGFLLVRGPGSYKSQDYVRVGLPFERGDFRDHVGGAGCAVVGVRNAGTG